MKPLAKPDHQLELVMERREEGYRRRDDTVGTYYYLHAVRAVNPGEQRPRSISNEWDEPGPSQGWRFPSVSPAPFASQQRLPVEKTSTAKKLGLCNRVASRNTARQSPGLLPRF